MKRPTVDTAHVLVEPTTTRESFYVAMTRGKHSNRAYVILDRANEHAQPHPGDNPDATARYVLNGVLQHVGAELSAHETITAEHEYWGSIAQLVAEYVTIAAAAQRDRWATLIRVSGLTDEQAGAAIESGTFGALTTELRCSEADHHTSTSCSRVWSPRAGSPMPTTSPPSCTIALPAPPPAPQTLAVPARHHG